MAAADNTQAGGTLFGFKNPFARFKKKKVDPADFIINGEFRNDLFQAALAEQAALDAERNQLIAGFQGLGKTDGGGRTNIGLGRPSMSPVTSSPYGFPMDINLSGGNVMPGASTQPFGSMEQLMARANLLEQAKRKRVF